MCNDLCHFMILLVLWQDTLEALCECKDKRTVCGNDNKTYASVCKLREVAHSKPELEVSSWKPCFSGTQTV